MSLFGKILAIINLLVAPAVLVLAGAALQARSNWAKHMEELTRQRDGIRTDRKIDEKNPSLTELDRFIAKLPPDSQKRIQELVDKKAGSNFVRRMDAGREIYPPPTEDFRRMLEELGPDDNKRLIQRHIKLDQPKIRVEARSLADQKATMIALKDRYQSQIVRLQEDIDTLNLWLGREKTLHGQVLAENQEREREITRIYAELEEALANQNVAEGRQKDMADYLARTQKRAQQLGQKNQQLAGELERRELGN